jgi:ornithine cyclodeaminase/alanine dehydrogenase-like protein (mu-crystallin family)
MSGSCRHNVTATNTFEPILKGDWLKPGAHVDAVGAPRPIWREFDDCAMANTIIVDSREAALKEAGDVILSNAAIYVEAGEIFAGIKSIPANRTTIFKSVGFRYRGYCFSAPRSKQA